MQNIPPERPNTAPEVSPNGSGVRSGSRLCRYCSRGIAQPQTTRKRCHSSSAGLGPLKKRDARGVGGVHTASILEEKRGEESISALLRGVAADDAQARLIGRD